MEKIQAERQHKKLAKEKSHELDIDDIYDEINDRDEVKRPQVVSFLVKTPYQSSYMLPKTGGMKVGGV
jgi:hypothetical protein